MWLAPRTLTPVLLSSLAAAGALTVLTLSPVSTRPSSPDEPSLVDAPQRSVADSRVLMIFGGPDCHPGHRGTGWSSWVEGAAWPRRAGGGAGLCSYSGPVIVSL